MPVLPVKYCTQSSGALEESQVINGTRNFIRVLLVLLHLPGLSHSRYETLTLQVFEGEVEPMLKEMLPALPVEPVSKYTGRKTERLIMICFWFFIQVQA